MTAYVHLKEKALKMSNAEMQVHAVCSSKESVVSLWAERVWLAPGSLI